MFFADNFRECATLNAFHEEIFKLHFLLNQGRSIFSKKLVYKGRCGILFLLFSLVSYSSGSCQATRSQTQFSVKELAIAKIAKYI